MGADLGPRMRRALLRAWLDAVDLRLNERDLLALLQSDGFSHAALERRARAAPRARLWSARSPAAIAAPGEIAAAAADALRRLRGRDPLRAAPRPSSAARSASWRGARTSRSGWRCVADGIGGMHGVTHTIDEIRERGVPGFEVEVVGTDPRVDRRLSAVAEVDIPFYAGLRGRRAVAPGVVESLSEGRYGVAALCSPGPAGVAAALIGRVHRPADRGLATTPS